MLLEKAGYNYNLVQQKVNELCEKHSKFYTVQAADTLDVILDKFNLTAEKFLALNYKLEVGSTIQIEE